MGQGFFDLGTGYDPVLSKKDRSTKKKIGCGACGLDKSCLSPNMNVYGRGKKKILIVGEAPGRVEDEKGIPFTGKSGQLLKNVLDEIGVNLSVDCWRTNAVTCHPPENREPSSIEIAECRSKLLFTIAQLKPEVILTLGTVALEGLIGHRLLEGRITGIQKSAFFGDHIPDQVLDCYICPTFHPAYILRKCITKDGRETNHGLKRIWKKQIKSAVKLSGQGFYHHNYESDFEITTEPLQAIEWIDYFLSRKKHFAYDYETTGIKPQRDGHEVLIASLSDGEKGYAFPFFFDNPLFRKKWRELMESEENGKIAHHVGFEYNWTHQRSDKVPVIVKNWVWDTMLGAHALNNKKPTGLKYLVYVHFGVLGYDTEVDPYLSASTYESEKFGANAFNNLKKAPLKKSLKYGALDSLFTAKEYEFQKNRLNKKEQEALLFFVEGAICLSRLHQNGINLDKELMAEHYQSLSVNIDKYLNLIMNSEEVKQWKDKKEFNPNSDPMVMKLLYNLLGYKVYKNEDGEEEKSVDEEALKRYENKFCTNLVSYRKKVKMRDTYLAQFTREEVNGVLHPFFNLNRVDTFRSSSDSPNFQNIPKRDPEAHRIIRSIIRPSKGCRIIEYDYKAIEVTVAGCVFKDPNWLSYCRDVTKDMHRDTAMEILFFSMREWKELEKNISKQSRQASKNGYVFPSIYGSSGRKAAAGMWPQLPPEVKVHLREKGIRTFKDFEERMIKYDDEYWNVRYPEYGRRKRKLYEEYERKGYIEQLTGFRCYGPMDYTQVVNYPVQGPASHIKLKALTLTQNEIDRRKLKAKPIMEIHDSMLFDTPEEEEEELDKIMAYVGSVRIPELWDWIIAPIILEKERSAVNGRWNEMESCGYLQKEIL